MRTQRSRDHVVTGVTGKLNHAKAAQITTGNSHTRGNAEWRVFAKYTSTHCQGRKETGVWKDPRLIETGERLVAESIELAHC